MELKNLQLFKGIIKAEDLSVDYDVEISIEPNYSGDLIEIWTRRIDSPVKTLAFATPMDDENMDDTEIDMGRILSTLPNISSLVDISLAMKSENIDKKITPTK